jgi:hypothetical protein
MQVENIISKFGGLTRLARTLNMKHPTTVQGWRVRGSIPARHIPKIIEAARSHNIDISLSDFFSIEDGLTGKKAKSGKTRRVSAHQ